MEEQGEEVQRRGMTRRDALRRGAVIGGALVWAAPAVQTLARPAFAGALNGSPVGNTYSFVAVLFYCGGQYYRVKVNADDTVECGPTWQNDGCVYDFFRLCPDVQAGCPAGLSFSRDVNGGVTVTAPGCTVVNADFHNGTCCVNDVTPAAPICPPAVNGGGDQYCTNFYTGNGTDTAFFPGPAPNGNTIPCCS
jgi:hypothetical protein